MYYLVIVINCIVVDPGEIYNEIYAEAEEDLAKVQEKMPEVIEILKNIK